MTDFIICFDGPETFTLELDVLPAIGDNISGFIITELTEMEDGWYKATII